MENELLIHGPFGQFIPGTTGAILNVCCRQENIPLHIVENFIIGKEEITYRNNTVGVYKWLDGYPLPMFHWIDRDFIIYNDNLLVCIESIYKPKFKAVLSNNLLPALVVAGRLATPELHDFLMKMFNAKESDITKKLVTDSGAVFETGMGNGNGQLFVIEFWKLTGISNFLMYLNDNYIYTAHELRLRY